jgi:hypothetical protein
METGCHTTGRKYGKMTQVTRSHRKMLFFASGRVEGNGFFGCAGGTTEKDGYFLVTWLLTPQQALFACGSMEGTFFFV